MEYSKQKSARFYSNSDVLEDLWPEILMRLPVKTLCGLRSVCRSWNSLITSSFFVSLHHSFTRSIPSSSKACTFRDDLHFPFQFRVEEDDEDEDFYYTSVVDVVHGVVCISYTLNSCYDSTILWNPAIHKYLTLPRLPFPSHIESVVSASDEAEECARFFCSAVGFGYDDSMNDFKVVRIWMCREYIESPCGFIPTTYEVYSTREGLWKTGIANNLKSKFMFDISTSRTGCFVNGTISWLVSSYDLWESYVLMFDCESGEFTIVDFPQEIYEPKMTWTDPSQNPVRKAELVEYGGMLSALVHRHWEDRIELWAMKERGLATSWNKLFTIDNDGCDVLHQYQLSFLKLAPCGLNQWIEFNNYVDRFRRVYGYEESMFFMDDSEAESYTDEEIVDIFIPRFSKAYIHS